MKRPKPIVVATIACTCCACPSQWEGLTEDGRCLYGRYRWGHLSIRIGDPTEGQRKRAVITGKSVVEMNLGTRYHGALDYEDLVKLTNGVFEWPIIDC